MTATAPPPAPPGRDLPEELARRGAVWGHLRGFLLAAVIGVIGGFAAILFQNLTDESRRLFFSIFRVHESSLLRSAERLLPWERLVMPALGAAVAAVLLFGLFRRKGSYGIANIMEAVSLRRHEIGLGDVLSRSVCTAAVIGTGGSTGREGPIIQIGSAVATSLGRVARLSPRDLSVLVACGAAAGMAGAYNAPIGAAMFVMEVILGSFVMEQFAPVIVASVTSTLTVHAVVGEAPVYVVPQLTLGSPWEAVPIFALGILSALTGWGLLASLAWFEDRLHALPLPRVGLAVLGGLLVGALGIVAPEVWGNGYDGVSERILPAALPLGTLVVLLVAKVVATSVTSGAGVSGGVFTPTLFVGAALGASFGLLVRRFMPAVDPSLFALVGMGSVLAATTHAPLMAILILFEMTRDPPLIAPLMLGAITATLFARWVHADSIYMARLKRRGVTLPAGAEESALLRTYTRDLLRHDAPVLPAQASLGRVLDVFLNSRRGALYVVGDGGRYVGVARLHDVKAVFGDVPEAGSIIAMDVAVPVAPVAEDEAIGSVLARFQDTELDEVPVVAAAADRRFVGTLSRRDILAMLRQEVLVEPSRPVRVRARDGAGTTFLDLPPGWRVAEIPAPPESWGRPLDVEAWRAARGETPLVVLRDDGRGGRAPLPPSAAPLRDGDVVVTLGPAPQAPASEADSRERRP